MGIFDIFGRPESATGQWEKGAAPDRTGRFRISGPALVVASIYAVDRGVILVTGNRDEGVTTVSSGSGFSGYLPSYQTMTSKPEATMFASIPTPTRTITRPGPASAAGLNDGGKDEGHVAVLDAESRSDRTPARAPRTTGSESSERRFQALKQVDMFSVLTDVDLRRISDTLAERNYTPGSAIVHADDPAGGHFFVVAEGEVAVILETQDGKETVLATLQPGDFFGEMSLLDENPRAATARAVGHARLMLLRREDFRRHLRDCPQMAFALLIEMNRRLRQSNRKVAGLSYRSMHARVAGAILGLMEDKGVRQRDEGGMRVLIRNRPTQKFLAEMAGTTRESVSRTMSAWVRNGWLRAKGKDLFILEEERIKAFTI
jgi:CRP/FNR family transcriptional regulator, cyclic AMP receptor protein